MTTVTPTTTYVRFDRHYGLAVLSAVGIGAQCFFTPWFTSTPMRKDVFSEKFMEEHFGDIHRRETGFKPPKNGYPDQGFGRYSDRLTYSDWFKFASAQRAHGNFVEQVGIVIPMILVAGTESSQGSAALGLAYFIGRILYSMGYASISGTDWRGTGGAIVTCSFIGLLGLSLKACWSMIKDLF